MKDRKFIASYIKSALGVNLLATGGVCVLSGVLLLAVVPPISAIIAVAGIATVLGGASVTAACVNWRKSQKEARWVNEAGQYIVSDQYTRERLTDAQKRILEMPGIQCVSVAQEFKKFADHAAVVTVRRHSQDQQFKWVRLTRNSCRQNFSV